MVLAMFLCIVGFLPKTMAVEPAKKDFFCCIVDRSGSIEQNGLTGKVLEGITQYLIPQVKPNTVVELVIFDTKADAPLVWSDMEPANVQNFCDTFTEKYKPNVQTNITKVVVKDGGLFGRDITTNAVTITYFGTTRLFDTVEEAIARALPKAADYNNMAFLIISDGNDDGGTQPGGPKLWGSKRNHDWVAATNLATQLEAINPRAQFRMDALGFTPEPWLPPPFIVITSPIDKPLRPELPKPPPPSAEFKPSALKPKVGEEVLFVLNETRYTDSTLWDFGDRAISSSSGNSVSHVYAPDAVGERIVRATVIGPGGTNTATKSISVQALYELKADFDWDPKPPRAGGSVVLKSLSVGEIESWAWQVGGKGSNGREFSLKTPIPEVLSVSLTVKDASGRTSEPTVKKLQVLPKLADAGFKAEPDRVIAGQTVRFIPTMTGEGESRVFLVDGKALPGNEWTAPSVSGKHTVTCIAKNAAGEETQATKDIFAEAASVAAFKIASPQADWRSGNPIAFANNSSGTSNRYSWRFGDGTTFTGANPEPHRYTTLTTAVYTVSLTVTDSDGMVSAATNLLTILPIPASADFLASAERAVVGKSITFTAAEIRTGDTHTWTDNGVAFGGNAGKVAWTPAMPGLHKIVHSVKGDGGENKPFERIFDVKEALRAEFRIQTPKEQRKSGRGIVFADESAGEITQWNWNFGDGVTSTEKTPPAHTYVTETSTVYTVSLAVDGPDGTSSKDLELRIDTDITAAFSANPESGQLPLRGRPLVVRFRNKSIGGNGLSYLWNFGDGSEPSHEENPIHEYGSVSNYTVRLSVTDAATGETRNAPDRTVRVKPNTQIHDTFVWTGIIAAALLVYWILFLRLRPPPPAKTFLLGADGESAIPVVTATHAYECRKGQITLPYEQDFNGDCAKFIRINSDAESAEQWGVAAGPDGFQPDDPESGLRIYRNRSQVAIPAVEVLVPLLSGDEICFGKNRYTYHPEGNTRIERLGRSRCAGVIARVVLSLILVGIPLAILLLSR